VTAGFREFEFDLPEALLSSLIEAFDQMEGAALTHDHLAGIPDAQGVYQLLLNDEIVYIGKTDSEAGLRRRLSRHAFTIQHRANLEVRHVSFKAVRVFVFTAMDLESQLIRHYRSKATVTWNNSGFGSNDPGRQRDWTAAKPASFDILYPIDLNQKISLGLSGRVKVSEVLQALRRELPYTLRIEGAGVKRLALHTDFDEPMVKLPAKHMSVGDLISIVVAVLPNGWQATALAGRIILYKEHVENYPSGRIIARS
jgi:hypothetical protein